MTKHPPMSAIPENPVEHWMVAQEPVHPLELLARRCEQASGADRELEIAIWGGVVPGATRWETVIPANEKRHGWTIDETRENGRLIIVPAYSASIDAAANLVPAMPDPLTVEITYRLTAFVEIHDIMVDKSYGSGSAATPALALCAAALRARIAMEASQHLIDKGAVE